MSKELTYLQKLEKDYLRIEAENETLSSANQDLLHEVRVLKNQINDQTNLRILEFKVQNKQLLKQNKRYRERIEEIEAKNWEFIVQNKRYREALENIRTVKYDDEFNPYAYMMLEIIEWAEEALEGESE